MNKTLFSIVVACTLSWMGAHAQPIMSYDFESKIGTYEEITNGTVVLGNDSIGEKIQDIAFIGSTIGTKELTTGTGFPIGFDFIYNDEVMNQFAIGTHCYIALGKDQIKINPERSAFFMNDTGEGKTNIIQTGVNTSLSGVDNTEISYKLEGNAPNRILVVQYKNLGMELDWSGTVGSINMQIRLYETSNKIEMIYKGWNDAIVDKNRSVRVGIKGNDGDLHMRDNDAGDWQNTIKSTKDELMTWNEDSKLVDGLTYTFIPCKDCETPTAQPTNLVLIPKTISVSGSFNKVANADHYLTVMTETESLSSIPTDNNYYKTGDKLGNGTVIAFDTIATFETPETLSGAKTYYFHVFGANTYCMYGPKYNTVAPLVKSTITMPSGPASLEVKENGYEQVILKAEKNAAGNKILIAMTTEYCRDHLNNVTENGLFGQPTGTMTVGQDIEGGGKVIYIGEASASIPVEGLENNNLYHFIAWSLDDKGNYSTVGANANILTWGRLPYEPKYEQMPAGRPFQWGGEGDAFSINEYNGYRLFTRVAASPDGTINTLITPWMLLGEGRNRFILDLNIYIWSRLGNTPYNEWNENDIFEIQISQDGTNFEPICTYNKDNAPQLKTADSYARLYIPVDVFSNQKVKFRIYWKCYTGVDCYIKNIKIEERDECDYPIDLSVDASSIVGDQALASWKSQGDENLWEMRYRITGEEEWGEPFEVNSNPYLLTKLPPQSNIELQIRAKCSLTNHSVWSETCYFSSGYTIPFTENFSGNALPAGWSGKTGALADPTEFCSGTSCRPQWTWSTRPKGLILSASGVSADEWLLMPVIDLGDGSANYILNFDIMMLQALVDNNETYSVVISYDGGKTFNRGNVIKTFTKDELPTANQIKTFSVPLNGYKGQIQLALYVKSTTGKASTVQLQKVSIDASCPTDIVATVSDITPESAKVTWTSEAEDFYVFIRKAGEIKKQHEKVTVKEKIFDNLDARTTYEVGITKMCAVGDTARVVIAGFTTQALAPCEQVTNVRVTPSQFSAVVAWEGDAANYNIRYRLKGTENWTNRNTVETTYTIEGLESEKEYEYSIQSVCSAADGDQSEWTETKSFTTLAITCLPPTNVKVVPTHKSATVTWEGEADKYEVGFRKGSDSWSTSEVTGKTKEITELDPETTYSIRVRSICSTSDMSAWSASVDFSTTAIPTCVTPTNLTATSITENSAKLGWDADENNLTWDIHYRASTATSWTTVEQLTSKNYDLNDLLAGTIYLWSVKATCDEGRTSAWASQKQIETSPSGINDVAINALKVYVSGNVLNIINTEHCWINNIQIYSLNGQMLYTYTIDSDENILIPMNLHQVKTIIKVNGKDWSKSYPVFFE